MSLPDFDTPETDHTEQARRMNAAHRDSILQALRTLEFRHRDPHLVTLQRDLSRQIVTLSVLRALYDEKEKLTACPDIHLLSVIDEFVERVERAQLRVNRRSAELEGYAA